MAGLQILNPTAMNSPAVTIRPARPLDANQLVSLLETVGFSESTLEIESRIAEKGRSGDVVLVAVDGSRVLGIVTAHLVPLLHRPAPVGRITLLTVDQRVHGQGIGSALLARAEGELIALGCTIIEVISNQRYADSHGFYEHLGYEMTSLKFKKLIS